MSRIVFFGTPEFAVPSLEALIREGTMVVGVVTQPDRPRGRSRSSLVPPPVKVAAEAAGIPVLQPEKPIGDLFLTALRRLQPDLGVVVAYGHILRPEVLAIPREGMINVHASLLPRLRGAAPIQWAIANGESVTGISIMQMEEGLDSGPVLHTIPTPIEPDETGGQLTERLAHLGATALVEALAMRRIGAITPTPQDHSQATYAPKITRETARIDWNADAESIVARIRAFDPVPGAWTVLGGTELKLFDARAVDAAGVPGTILEAGGPLVVAARTGGVAIREVQPAGRRRMPVADWLHGRPATAGARLG
ncbi:MAG: methionyl-tRNA formyltransferase [Gemmatimonadota bacterium]